MDSLSDKAKDLVEAFAKLHAIRAKHANAWSQEEEDHGCSLCLHEFARL